MSLLKSKKTNLFLSGAAACLMTSMLYAPMANAIVPNDNNTPEDAVDEEGGVNGVGMFFRSDGFVCTGTLINPRTVLFAAHCVNNVPESAYGPDIQSAFSFDVNALPGFINWINNGFASNPDLNVFNVNQIFYNADSLANPQGQGFLEADIALASLDTPAADIPTWALLFSRLPDPAEIDPTTGTGYHVNITGYGRSGSGSFGDFQGIDWRRRAAENMLGALTSFDDRNTFLFGAAFGDLPQNLYRLDFDDPNKENAFDFNLYQDEPLANEGTTAGGDSGGPLILDAANNDLSSEDLVIGVLSGGSRFFGPQGFSSYGTESFYQPLFLFYEYIAATNPYRYVSAIEGDGAWEDASHWQTDLDPNYRIIDASGNVVNGFPDVEQDGINETDDPGFGAVCFDPEGDFPGDGCFNFATGENSPPSRPGPDAVGDATAELTDEELAALGLGVDTEAGDTSGGSLTVSGGVLSDAGGVLIGGESQAQNGAPEFAEEVAQNGVELVEEESQAPGDPLPAPTIDNGLAGATDFTPDNIDPPSGQNGTRRYFDVTLNNAGTTTLSSTVTIDRLTVAGAAGLAIDAEGSLTSLIDIEQTGGRIAVDGALNSVGDYTIFQGMLSGNGTITAPFVTSVAGMIAPGTLGTTGTLTIDGSAVLASGTSMFVDIGANGDSDLLAITGDSSLGGQVFFAPTADVRAGNEYTFLTTGGTQTGEFTTANISTILRPVISYTENSVIAKIEAGTYNDAILSGNAVQSSYAKLLDEARGTAALGDIYATLDLSSNEQIQAVLDSWAPVTETTNQSLAKATTDNLARFHRNRMNNLGSDSWGGTMTVVGNPVQMASNAEYMTSMSDATRLQVASNSDVKSVKSIPDDMAVYLSGAFIDGSGSAMPTTQNFADEDFDGWSVSAGLEHYVSEKVSVGASLSYSELEADGALGSQAASDYIAVTAYGQLRSSTGVVLDGQVSLGSFGSETSRTVAFPSASTLTTDDDSTAFTADLQVSKAISKKGLVFRPKAGLRNTFVDFDNVTETGGLAALNIKRDKLTSTQGRIGADFETAGSSAAKLRVSAEYVREFNSVDETFNAGFAASPASNNAPFALFGTDKSWFDVGGGLQFQTGSAKIDVTVDTTVGRKDIEAQTYRAGITFGF
ncbi:MAG: autotransporter domain-containing protein [Litorimonas sp.]